MIIIEILLPARRPSTLTFSLSHVWKKWNLSNTFLLFPGVGVWFDIMYIENPPLSK